MQTADLPAAGGIGTEDETTGVSGVRSTQAVDAAEKLQEALQVAKEAWDAWKVREFCLQNAMPRYNALPSAGVRGGPGSVPGGGSHVGHVVVISS